MSYFAGRWARAHTLVLNRDSTALAVLKELADDYREDLERCRIDSYKELAMNLGIKKPATVSEAVARLSALGLVRASSIISGRCVVGTKFELVGYEKKEWPESRQGKSVWVEIALARGIEPQPWWPSVDHIQKKGVLRKTDDPQKTEVVRKTDDPTPKNGIGVLRKTDEGYAEKRNPLTGNKQGITGNEQGFFVESPSGDFDDEAPAGLFDDELEKVDRPSSRIPACPYKKLVDLYHEVCPMLPTITVLTPGRKTQLKARWTEIYREEHCTSEAECLENFRFIFNRVAASRFLTGRTDPGPGRSRPFVANLDWLIKAANFVKVCENRYSN